MKTVVVYESMYGNTHLIADAIGRGVGGDVRVVPVSGAIPELLSVTDLLVIGGPTHGHGMTREMTRKAAIDAAEKPDAELVLDEDAEGPGLRDWFDTLVPRHGAPAAAFDTRFDAPAAFTGRASKGIAKRLLRHGYTLVAEPESFLVTKGNHLEDHEDERAVRWGKQLAKDLTRARPAAAGSAS
jgi:hypothetical protein